MARSRVIPFSLAENTEGDPPVGAETEKLNPVLDFALEELVGDFGDCACSSIADTR